MTYRKRWRNERSTIQGGRCISHADAVSYGQRQSVCAGPGTLRPARTRHGFRSSLSRLHALTRAPSQTSLHSTATKIGAY